MCQPMGLPVIKHGGVEVDEGRERESFLYPLPDFRVTEENRTQIYETSVGFSTRIGNWRELNLELRNIIHYAPVTNFTKRTSKRQQEQKVEMIDTASDVGGIISATSSMNTVMASRLVITNERRSPESGGRQKDSMVRPEDMTSINHSGIRDQLLGAFRAVFK